MVPREQADRRRFKRGKPTQTQHPEIVLKRAAYGLVWFLCGVLVHVLGARVKSPRSELWTFDSRMVHKIKRGYREGFCAMTSPARARE